MPIRETKAIGLEAISLATTLLQRARLAEPLIGLWEAADVQWWWRKPRQSDEAEKIFWVDNEGPIAAVILTSPDEGPWQCDPVVVANASVHRRLVWSRALEHAAKFSASFDVPVGNDDREFRELALQAGLTAGDQDHTTWMNAGEQPAAQPPRAGYQLVDRTQRAGSPHPMRGRNSDGVAQRLAQCSLYDPALDLAVEATDGRVAGYSLYWFDPITKVGLVEPMRVEDEFQRQGLARAMLGAGIERLVARGALRVKVSYESNEAGALYRSVGFREQSSTTWYQKR